MSFVLERTSYLTQIRKRTTNTISSMSTRRIHQLPKGFGISRVLSTTAWYTACRMLTVRMKTTAWRIVRTF